MDETYSSAVEGGITAIRFGLASRQEICLASISDSAISHTSQLSNPFLGLPLEFGRCESCGTSDPGKCEGHFGYIELPVPIYHPAHVSELKRLLSLLCLKCLKMKDNKFPVKNSGIGERLLASCCEDAAQVSVREAKTTDGAYYLQLKIPKTRFHHGFWNFLERYGFRYGERHSRTLLPSEVMEILKRIPQETKRKLARKGYFPQDGYILQLLPVPPNCLSIPDISDGVTVMSSDLSLSMLRKVLKQAEVIRSSRSGKPNFESHEVEANDLQTMVYQYLEVRGTAKAARDVDSRFGVAKESSDSATKAWLEKMRTLFIRKGSGFSSRSVITGDAYKRANEVGIPYEIAQRITFEEKVSVHNIRYLQDLVDNKQCLTYRDGASTYSLREGSKGHTFLKPGQVVHRRIMDGDIVFINRPPTTHKHSLQALSVYIHEDHTVKINPLICGPLGADFDGDCVHLFYPQSLAAKAEVLELFSVENQLLSSHSGNLNMQLAADSLLSLKVMFKRYFFGRPTAHLLAMFASSSLPWPAVVGYPSRPSWTASQILQTVLPANFDFCGDRYLIKKSEIVELDFSRDVVSQMLNEIVTSILFEKGPPEVMHFFNSLQPLLMENVFAEGFSLCLEDFYLPRLVIERIHKDIQDVLPLLYHLRSSYNELVQLQLESHLRFAKHPAVQFILKSSALGDVIDSRSDSAINKVVQQIGFLGLQLSDRGKFYSQSLIEDMTYLFKRQYPVYGVNHPSAEYGLIKSSFFSGVDPYEFLAHSICTREVIVRSTRGLSEPGTLFKNLMAILRDIVICYDGTVRNLCSNSIIQFEYGAGVGSKTQNLFPAGEPVGVLAATAMSTPAYKAVLDSSPNSNSSWDLMKEILLCRVNFRNDPIDRRVTLYLKDCGCGRKHCRENAACLVKSRLKRVSLKDVAVEFMIEYKDQRSVLEGLEVHAGLVGHVHLNEALLLEMNLSMMDILQRCQENLGQFRRKKKLGPFLRSTLLQVSDRCGFQHGHADNICQMPCLMFSLPDANDDHLDVTSNILANMICPILFETIVKGDPRICSVNIIWINPDATTWIKNPRKSRKGELALDIVLEKSVCKRSGDAWRIVLDSCLPVLHLIDTRRSIPYAIKQVQELLGISCVFDQAVQRLSTSVTMVAKGVLKEHLILLASSMTCSGNLIGFNSAGYKALSRSLNIEVPFTEATLFTPRKCFERASSKCHVDSLSSIVASCSWGKRVTVGTGSAFDILWGKDEVDRKNEDVGDVYGFLHTVRGDKLTIPDTGCLGVDIDNLDMINENGELPESPANNFSFEEPTFGDNGSCGEDWVTENAQNDSANKTTWSSWTRNEASAADAASKEQEKLVESNGWNSGSWGRNNKEDDTSEPNMAQSGGWSAWGTEKADKQGNESMTSWGEANKNLGEKEGTSWVDKANRESSWNAGSWGRNNKNDDTSEPKMAQSGGWSAWGTEMADKHGNESMTSWGETNKNQGEKDVTSWADKANRASSLNAGSWGKNNKNDNTSEEKMAQSGGWSTWGTEKANKQDNESTTSWGKPNQNQGEKDVTSWADKSNRVSSWSKGAVENWGNDGHNAKDGNDWGNKSEGRPQVGNDWTSSADIASGKGTKDGDWGGKGRNSWNKDFGNNWGDDTRKAEDVSWGTETAAKSEKSGGWDAKSWEKRIDGGSQVGKEWTGSGNSLSGDGRKQNAWGQKGRGSWGKGNNLGDDSSKSNVVNWENSTADGSEKPGEVAKGWGKMNDDGAQVGKSWSSSADAGGSQAAADDNEKPNLWEKRSGDYRKRNNFEGSQRRGSNPEWKPRKNRPPMSSDMSQDNLNIPRMFTVTRQRVDLFTTEEQDILSEVEPIMQSLRRIMYHTGYNDGDPFSAEDQSYIVDHVLNYHPDKATKIGAGIDHIMVNRHSNFTESRCFYVVSTDGRKEDFSYIKCLQNYIKGKYPDQAEAFNAKYFSRAQRGGRERSVAPEEPTTAEKEPVSEKEPAAVSEKGIASENTWNVE